MVNSSEKPNTTRSEHVPIARAIRKTLALLGDWNTERDRIDREGDAEMLSLLQAGFLQNVNNPFILSSGGIRPLLLQEHYVDPLSDEKVKMLRVASGVIITLAAVHIGAGEQKIQQFAHARAILDTINFPPAQLDPLAETLAIDQTQSTQDRYIHAMQDIAIGINIRLSHGIVAACEAIERQPVEYPLRHMYEQLKEIMNTMLRVHGIKIDTRHISSNILLANFLITGSNTAEDMYMLALRTAMHNANGNIDQGESDFRESYIPSQLATLGIGAFYQIVNKLRAGNDYIPSESLAVNSRGGQEINSRVWAEMLRIQKLAQNGQAARTGCPAFPEVILFIQGLIADQFKSVRERIAA